MTRLHILLTAALGCAHAAFAQDRASADNVRGFCAAVPPPGFSDRAAELVNSPAAQAARAGNFRAATTPIYVKIFLHVVAASTKPADGYVTKQQMNDQFNVLKNLFAPSNIVFVLGTIDYRVNASEAIDSPGTELPMKKRLRKGDYKALNIYVLKNLRDNALGYCTFPGAVQKPSDSFYYDGCSLRFDTIPGGSATGYNLGKTAVHEAGHWFGLLHTFEGGSCTGPGDQISDTPAQLSPTSGCPTGRDSCPNQPGLDPITNYMDYSTEQSLEMLSGVESSANENTRSPCYTQFTSLQAARMLDMYNKYRRAG